MTAVFDGDLLSSDGGLLLLRDAVPAASGSPSGWLAVFAAGAKKW